MINQYLYQNQDSIIHFYFPPFQRLQNGTEPLLFSTVCHYQYPHPIMPVALRSHRSHRGHLGQIEAPSTSSDNCYYLALKQWLSSEYPMHAGSDHNKHRCQPHLLRYRDHLESSDPFLGRYSAQWAVLLSSTVQHHSHYYPN